MANNNQRGRKNNNPEGRNQYSNGWADTAKERPMATAAAAAAAVGAGVFLWSRRNQISEQISNLSTQVTDWADEMRSGNSGDSNRELMNAGGADQFGSMQASGSKSRQSRSSGTNMNPAGSGSSNVS